MTKIINSDGLKYKAFNISLPHLFQVENRIFGLPKHINWLKQTGPLGQLAVCKMPNFDAVDKQQIEKDWVVQTF